MQIIHAKQALTPTGWMADVEICINEAGRIDSVQRQERRCDQSVDLALPAPANLHSHTFQRAMGGLTERRGPRGHDSFWSWRKIMYQFLDQLTPEDVQSIAALAFMEMMEAGYGSVAEFHYLHHAPRGLPYQRLSEMTERIIEAAQAVGIGLVHLPVLYQFGGCDRRQLEGGQQRFGCSVEQFGYLLEEARASVAQAPSDFSIGVAPHSLRAVDSRGLQACIELAGDGPIHMHLAEQLAEVDEVLEHLGSRPIEWLLASLPVDTRWCLVHCTQMTAEETIGLAKTGAVVGLCPITESSLGDGIFAGVAYTEHGGAMGVGSDSNIHVAYFEELCTLEYSQRLRDKARVRLATADASVGRYLIEKTTRGGHQAIGRDAGYLAEGAQADILGIATDNRWLCHRRGDMVLDSLVFSGHSSNCVSDVWSAGRHQIKDGRHVRHDQIVSAFQSTMARLTQDGFR
ncbi:MULTISPECIES: formimidoylglutamate deiminase [unclassified Roseitalea]|uniref:formimidoylglutamate deiminase n=1 Tax=unclassified Roseitalea TaxID=2639107 RepID=UPI00273CFB51|nr:MULTISPECIES: formimidoylglutamate deiminase [unclassified Roseitalea]